MASHQSFLTDPIYPPPIIPIEPILPTNIDSPFTVSDVTDSTSDHPPTNKVISATSPSLPIKKKRARAKSTYKCKTEHILKTKETNKSTIVSDLSPVTSRAPTPTPKAEVKPEPIHVSSPQITSNSKRPSKIKSPPTTIKSPHSANTPKSHTRRCREKVTRQFEHLLEVLPRPPIGVEVKHKAQVLDYTIKIFKDLLLKRTTLQTEIALASKPALRQWMNGTIAAASLASGRSSASPVPLSAILEPFLGLYCIKKRWSYGEMWLVEPDRHMSLSSCVFNSEDSDVLRRLDSFASVSKSRYGQPSRVISGLVGRISASCRPEWLNDLSSDVRVFDRAAMAGEHGLTVAEAVPVTLDGSSCTAVMVFSDVVHHSYSTADITTLMEYTTTLSQFYLEYISGLPEQNSKEGTAQPLGMDVVSNISNCAVSAMSNDRAGGLKIPLSASLPQTSETSSTFFGENGFMRHSIQQE